jgi:hypothetical protein
MIEVLKQMVKALECALSEDKPYIDECKQAIQAGKQAIAELESQEPVAKLKTSNVLLRCHSCGYSDKLTMQIEYTYPPQRTEQNFCSRCGKRTKDLTHIHTCTPPQD